MDIAKNATKPLVKLRKYIYKLNYQVLAENIEQADTEFEKQSGLLYKPKNKEERATNCPLISRIVILSPDEMSNLLNKLENK